jgi:hypothetical protein
MERRKAKFSGLFLPNTTHKEITMQFSQCTFLIPRTQDKITLSFSQIMTKRIKPEEVCFQQTLLLIVA